MTATIFIAAVPEHVFPYLTTPALMVTWMGQFARLDPRPGGELAVDVDGSPIRGRYVELDPPNRLVFTWGFAGSGQLPPGASTVEVTLTAEGQGTRVELEHRGLPAEERERHEPGWRRFLEALASVIDDQHRP